MSEWGAWGTIPEWLALVGIAIAIFQILAGKRRANVELLVHAWSKAEDKNQGLNFIVVDIINAGESLAILKSLQVVGGEIAPNPAYPVQAALVGGGHTRIWIDTDNPEKVWFRFEWVRPRDRRFEYAAWRPLINGDQLAFGRKWVESNRRSGARPNLRLIRDRWPRAVDPDHVSRERMRVSWGKSYSARRARMLPTVDSKEPQWKLGLMDPR